MAKLLAVKGLASSPDLLTVPGTSINTVLVPEMNTGANYFKPSVKHVYK
jgi:hypothetical protein